jgi:hypothetical protein
MPLTIIRFFMSRDVSVPANAPFDWTHAFNRAHLR